MTSSRKLLAAVAVAVAIFALYQGGMALVRAYVNTKITGNHGNKVPAFSLEDRSGTRYGEADLAGKVGVLHFIRSYCHSCDEEKDEVRAFAAGLDPEKVLFLSVMLDEVMGFPPEDTRRTLERARFEHPVLRADEAFVNAFHGAGWAKVTPVTYFIAPDGTIATSLRGPQTRATLAAALRRTVATAR